MEVSEIAANGIMLYRRVGLIVAVNPTAIPICPITTDNVIAYRRARKLVARNPTTASVIEIGRIPADGIVTYGWIRFPTIDPTPRPMIVGGIIDDGVIAYSHCGFNGIYAAAF